MGLLSLGGVTAQFAERSCLCELSWIPKDPALVTVFTNGITDGSKAAGGSPKFRLPDRKVGQRIRNSLRKA